jgi:hypothetical protein
MEIKGKLLQVMELRQISDKFALQEFLIETEGQYPKKIMLQSFKTATESLMRMRIGDSATFFIEPESKEYNGKWYTSIKCFKII